MAKSNKKEPKPSKPEEQNLSGLPAKKHIGLHVALIIISFLAGAGLLLGGFFVYRAITTTAQPGNLVELDDIVLSQEELVEVLDILEGREEELEESEGEEENQISRNLKVDWTDRLIEVDLSTAGIGQSFDAYDEATRTAFLVGEVLSEPFAGKSLYLIKELCGGPCPPVHYRVIDDRGGQGLVLLKNLSNYYSWDNQDSIPSGFTVTTQYDIPELHLPNQIFASANGVSQRFLQEPFSPAVTMDEFLDRTYYDYDLRISKPRPYNSNFRHSVYGTLYEDILDGYFIASNPDHTVQLYRLAYPFTLKSGTGFMSLVESTQVNTTLDNGDRVVGEFTPVGEHVCPPRSLAFEKGIDNQLTKVGHAFDEDLYAPTDPAGELYTKVYGNFYAREKPSIEEFAATNPLLYFKDNIGRWARIINLDYYPQLETECPYWDSAL